MIRRTVWLAVALLPVVVAVGSFFTEWRPSSSLVALAGYAMFVLGGIIALLNFFLSFLRAPLLRRLDSTAELRHVSGIPLFGALNVVGLVLCPRSVLLSVVALLLLPLDTGSITWFVPMVWHDRSFWRR